MALYSLGQRTAVTAATAPNFGIIGVATIFPRLLEFGFSQVTAVAGTYSLARSTNASVQTTTTLPQAENPADPAAKTTTAMTWSTPPTRTNDLRRLTCPATIGAGIIWTFPRGLMINATNSMDMWVLATAPVLDLWITIDE
jgi:hypothetical protein